MANPIKWIIEAVGGNMAGDIVLKSILGMWNATGVKEKVTETAASVVRDAFTHDWSDEQYMNQAMIHDPVTKRDRVKISAWLAALKKGRIGDEQRNRFRKATTIFKWTGTPGKDREQVFDVEETAKVLHGIAELNNKQWKLYVINMNLQRPMLAKRFLVIVQKSQSRLSMMIERRKKAYNRWVAGEFVPTMQRLECEARAAAAKKPSWL